MNFTKEYLDQIMAWLQSGVNAITANAPEFVRQTLNYYFYSNLVWLVFALIVVIGSVFVLRWMIENQNDPDDVGIIFISVVASFSVILIIVEVGYLLKIKLAPILFMLTKIKALL